MTKDPIEALEELNKENYCLKNSKEYLIGQRVFKGLEAIRHFDVMQLVGYVKSVNLQRRELKIKSKKQIYFNCGEYDHRSRGVAYTCITNNYDLPEDPLLETADYYLFVDEKFNQILRPNSSWRIENINSFPAIKKSANANRYCKMHPYELFGKNYDYAVYTDGNIQIISDLTSLYSIAKQSPLGVAMHRHSVRNCIYQEAEACIEANRGSIENIRKQVEKYKHEGFPNDFGMLEATIIVFDLNNVCGQKLMNNWWLEYNRSGSGRDQLALPYVIWKMGYKIEDIGDLGNDLWQNPKFRVMNWHKNR